jgi:transcriptional regulator GlxA family with amidase domain
LLWRELEHEEGLIHRHPLAGAELEQLLMTGLLLTQPSNYSAALHEDRPPPAPPRAVRRTVELIDAHPELPHTVGELARAASVSVRSLQDAFHRTLGVSPTAYLRQVRLERAHADLSAIAAGRESTTVTEVAYRWGFTHLGRFSEAYRRRFGQSPSTTQRGCFGAGPHHVSGAGRPTTRS